MRLTRQTTFALRAMVHCAEREPELSHVKDIAAANGISEFFLFKIITLAAERGLIETVRGRRGGIRLARPASTITLLEVVEAMEDRLQIEDWTTQGEAGHSSQALHSALEEAVESFRDALAARTLASIIGAGRPQ